MAGVGKRRRWFDGLLEDDDRDPVQAIVDRVLETRQARELFQQTRTVLDRLGNAIDPHNAPAPTPPPQHRAPAKVRPDPLLVARAVLHFSGTEPLTKKQITQRRRELAAVCHPDKGGSDQSMQRVNRAADLLLASVK